MQSTFENFLFKLLQMFSFDSFTLYNFHRYPLHSAKLGSRRKQSQLFPFVCKRLATRVSLASETLLISRGNGVGPSRVLVNQPGDSK